MADRPNALSERVQSNWWLPFCLLILGWGLFLPLSFLDPVFGPLIYLLTVVSLITLLLLVLAKRKTRQRPGIFLLLAIYWVMTWALIKNPVEIRGHLRWLFHSKDYKAEVLKQPSASNGEFKHIEWDGWGFPGAGDTVVYLVFDPEDSLLAASKSKASGALRGIPCAVVGVKRLESHWYTVLFYTETEWGQCA
jgi:hypothetical protein